MRPLNSATHRTASLALIILIAVCGHPLCAEGANKVELTVVERAGVDRTAEPITSGIPFPKGELASAENVRLLRDGKEVPAQFRATGLWPQDKSVRWLLVDTITDIKANEKQTFILEYGEGVKATARHPQWLSARRTEDGGIELERDANGMRVKGVIGLRKQNKTEPSEGPQVRGLKAMVTRAIPGAANTGRSHLIYVKCPDDVKAEAYTLRFTTDREFAVTGAKAGAAGTGTWAVEFMSSDKAISIPKNAWLPYAYPKKGDTYTFSTVPAGSTTVYGEGDERVELLESGPIRVTMRSKEKLVCSGTAVLEYTGETHAYAGPAHARVILTVENNNHGGRTETGNARNADIGGTNCVFLKEMTWPFPLAVKKDAQVTVGGAADREPIVRKTGERIELYQDSDGGANWNRYQNEKFHPRPNSYVTFKGYKIFEGDKEIAKGDRALGWLDVSDAKKGETVCLRNFWQNFPKSLAVDKDGTVEIGLFPGRYAGDFALRSGEHKTHEILFQLHDGPAPKDGGRALAIAFSNPLRLEPSPEWFAKTLALGVLHPQDMTHYKAYEIRNLSTIGVFPDGVKPGPSLLSRIEEMDFYGWMDYGDVPIDFEAPSGQWGMKYDLDYQMAQQWARTLNPAWWRLFAAAARHTADIDIHHQPHYPGLHFVKGGVWAHSLHDEPGNLNPHRNYNHFTKDLCFGARGLAAYYYLTGDWKARDACLEIAENALAEYMSPQKDPGDAAQNNRMGARGDACTLNRLLEGYLLSGEQKYLDRARWQVKACAFDGKPAKHPPTSLWSSVFYMMALARYVELFPDDAAAKSYLLAHIETLRKSADPVNGILYEITPQPDGSVTGKGTCSHYNIMAADALAVGYRLTGDMKYIETARKCFDYGVKNACWKDGPPTYFHVHSANGATHGNVFMALDSELRAKGK